MDNDVYATYTRYWRVWNLTQRSVINFLVALVNTLAELEAVLDAGDPVLERVHHTRPGPTLRKNVVWLPLEGPRESQPRNRSNAVGDTRKFGVLLSQIIVNTQLCQYPDVCSAGFSLTIFCTLYTSVQLVTALKQ